MVKHRLQQVELFVNVSRPKKLSLPFIYYTYVITRLRFAFFSCYFRNIFCLACLQYYFFAPLIVLPLESSPFSPLSSQRQHSSFPLSSLLSLACFLLLSIFLLPFLSSNRSVIEDSTVQKFVKEVHQERKTFNIIGDQYSRFH